MSTSHALDSVVLNQKRLLKVGWLISISGCLYYLAEAITNISDKTALWRTLRRSKTVKNLWTKEITLNNKIIVHAI